MVPSVHANDGGGSIRIPAACNGLVGMKPTRGRTPTGPEMGLFLWGMAVEFAETRTIRDSAALRDALAGPDDGYFYAAMPPRRGFLAAAMTPPGKLRIGVRDRLPGAAPISREVRSRRNATRTLLGELGHECSPLRVHDDTERYNESSVRFWAATLGYFRAQFSAATGRKIGPKTVEAQ